MFRDSFYFSNNISFHLAEYLLNEMLRKKMCPFLQTVD